MASEKGSAPQNGDGAMKRDGSKAVVIATWPFGLEASRTAGEQILKGVPVIDALVAGAKVVEEDPTTGPYFVGVGGTPNAVGTLEMDAAVMRGNDCKFGGVLALQKQSSPAQVASCVLKEARHSVYAGDGALRFANKQGFENTETQTEQSRDAYEKYSKAQNVSKTTSPPHGRGHDTLGVVACNEQGQVAAVVTTSGMAFKDVGRVGDSALPGCGLYADDDGGAAAATGDGDQILRFCPCLRVVELMRGDEDGRGAMRPLDACKSVIERIRRRLLKAGDPMIEIAIVAVNTKGEYGAASSFPSWQDHVTGDAYDGFPAAVHVDGVTDVLVFEGGTSTTGSAAFPTSAASEE
eukprot:m.106402 g.106402  ORF g.106402 m.106402 type:complete len:351 (-) comp16898_c0_seq5:276-1328(-)